MKTTRDELLPGVFLNHVHTDKFKIATLSISLLTQLNRDTASMNALIPAVLCRGSSQYNDMEKLSNRLDELYGSSIMPMIRKIGEIQVIGLLAGFPEDNYLPHGESVTKDVISLAAEVLLDPDTRGGLLRQDYVNSEREKLAEVIRSRVNSKGAYSLTRCIEEMCCYEDFACSRLGSVEECERIHYRKLTRQYQSLLEHAPIEIFYCGQTPRKEVIKMLRDALCTMPRGEIDYDIGTDVRMNTVEEESRHYTEEMSVNQARLVLGFRLGQFMEEPDKPSLSVFNAVYGSGVTSRLFTHVRERLQLCYSVSSIADAHKGVLFAAAGIDAEDFTEAKDEILHQLNELRENNITEEELDHAKAALLSDLASVEDNAGALESFCLNNTIDGLDVTVEEYSRQVAAVTREKVSDIANSVVLDMVYLLKNGEDGDADSGE